MTTTDLRHDFHAALELGMRRWRGQLAVQRLCRPVLLAIRAVTGEAHPLRCRCAIPRLVRLVPFYPFR